MTSTTHATSHPGITPTSSPPARPPRFRRAGLARRLWVVASLALAATASHALGTETVASRLNQPWSVAFLPDGRFLVTEKPGQMLLLSADGRERQSIAGLPAIAAGGQCGLFDVLPDPTFAETRRLYWAYAEPASAGRGNSTAVASGTLSADGSQLNDVRVIFSQQPKVASSAHCGGRLAFDRAGHLFITLGERFSEKDEAQNLDNHLGKVVRIFPDGKVPPDNPYVDRQGARPEIWSYGHRNVQGAAINPVTGELWTSEHGPQGGDEVNIDRAGRNYGWPVITFGRNYGSGTRIGEGTERDDVPSPLRTWVPTSIAPSGMAFLTSNRYPGWENSLFIGALRRQMLVRLPLDGDRITGEEHLLTNLNERIRDVRQGPDGWLYVLTDSQDGKLLRLKP